MLENLTTITPKQRAAIQSLLTSGDVTQAAKTAGISRETVYRWMTLPTFQAALQQATREALSDLSRSLVQLGDKAAKVLNEVLSDPDAPIQARVRCTEIVFSNILKVYELVSLEERVSKLEGYQNEQKNRNTN